MTPIRPRRADRHRAPAKINLTLQVLGLRSDGYHELRTIFQSLALHDTLTLRAVRGPFRLECDDPACPADRTNLVWRAAERVWRAAGRRGAPRNLAIHLTKRIPMQAGLGGGSSDAAAALRALGRRWRVGEVRLRAIAASLGADVPFFFEGGTVLGVERGDLVFPLADRPAAWVVLVLPDFGVSTRDAYQWFDRDTTALARASRARDDGDPERVALRNDLQVPVAKRHPGITRLVSALKRLGASDAAMSGSGLAVFGLFGRRAAAERAVRALKGAGRCRTLVTRTVSRTVYRRLVGA